MRATEGETVANTARMQQLNVCYDGQQEVLGETQEVAFEGAEILPEALDAVTTAQWISDVLEGKKPVPANIQLQLQWCREWSARVAEKM